MCTTIVVRVKWSNEGHLRTDIYIRHLHLSSLHYLAITFLDPLAVEGTPVDGSLVWIGLEEHSKVGGRRLPFL